MRVLPSAKAVLHRTALIALLSAPTLAAAQCGGSFQNFVRGLKDEAVSAGYAISTVNEFFNGVSQDQSVLRADRSQGVFQKPFVEFSRRLISQSRLNRGRSKGEEFDKIFDRIETTYGINRGVLLAFWAFETDYGAVQGDFNTRNALVTLAHDCRRPDLFRPQIFSALELYRKGDFDPARTTGAWAGEIGMVQMLPSDILEHGVDADGDGHVTLKTSAADALMSAARMLSHLGWRANEPWLQEVTIPADMDVSASGPAYKKSLADWEAMGVAPRTTSFAMKDDHFFLACHLRVIGRKIHLVGAIFLHHLALHHLTPGKADHLGKGMIDRSKQHNAIAGLGEGIKAHADAVHQTGCGKDRIRVDAPAVAVFHPPLNGALVLGFAIHIAVDTMISHLAHLG